MGRYAKEQKVATGCPVTSMPPTRIGVLKRDSAGDPDIRQRESAATEYATLRMRFAPSLSEEVRDLRIQGNVKTSLSLDLKKKKKKDDQQRGIRT